MSNKNKGWEKELLKYGRWLASSTPISGKEQSRLFTNETSKLANIIQTEIDNANKFKGQNKRI